MQKLRDLISSDNFVARKTVIVINSIMGKLGNMFNYFYFLFIIVFSGKN